MIQKDIDIRFDRPRQMAYHVIVYFLCRLVLPASSVIGAAQYSAKRFRPGFAGHQVPLASVEQWRCWSLARCWDP